MPQQGQATRLSGHRDRERQTRVPGEDDDQTTMMFGIGNGSGEESNKSRAGAVS